jgi:translation elongation factor EF-Tu-like GTPase
MILLLLPFSFLHGHYVRVDDPSNSDCTGIIGATQMYVALPIISGAGGVMPRTYYIIPCINE